MKKITQLLLIFVFVLTLSGCKKKEETPKTKIEYSTEEISLYEYSDGKYYTNHVDGTVKIIKVNVKKTDDDKVNISVGLSVNITKYKNTMNLGVFIKVKLLDESGNEIDDKYAPNYKNTGYDNPIITFYDVPENATYKIIVEN